jgi:hypothetical protein
MGTHAIRVKSFSSVHAIFSDTFFLALHDARRGSMQRPNEGLKNHRFFPAL